MNLKIMALVSGILFFIILLMYAQLANKGIRNELEVKVLGYDSGCYSNQNLTSIAKWEGENILMNTTVQTNVPCYELSSINARQDGNLITVNVFIKSKGGICVECIGYQKISYKILSPNAENGLNIAVNINIKNKTITQNTFLPLE